MNPTDSATPTPTATATPTATGTPTATPSPTPTDTLSPTPTATPSTVQQVQVVNVGLALDADQFAVMCLAAAIVVALLAAILVSGWRR